MGGFEMLFSESCGKRLKLSVNREVSREGWELRLDE